MPAQKHVNTSMIQSSCCIHFLCLSCQLTPFWLSLLCAAAASVRLPTKKALVRSALSCSSTPLVTCTTLKGCLRSAAAACWVPSAGAGSEPNKETQLPSAPSLGCLAPYTSLLMRLCSMAPAPEMADAVKEVCCYPGCRELHAQDTYTWGMAPTSHTE